MEIRRSCILHAAVGIPRQLSQRWKLELAWMPSMMWVCFPISFWRAALPVTTLDDGVIELARNNVGESDFLSVSFSFCNPWHFLSPQKMCTPLHVAARYNHTEVFRFLMSQGGDATMKDSVGFCISPGHRQRHFLQKLVSRIHGKLSN